ncbi:Docosahexaenoic acid omega-hydroxylase CYP4F3 [Mycena venus]|uniref:Docosahexaenoic acid omega-hydroxylase CYP4F3 n=1 Tax=Mycena venus TaxID=2733690 RepID=A0A8H6YSX0_9AGAR|nr:Docosahexaenoic acid omega-hydroxylase CYP4F3 [Mycena venus]
MSLFLVARLVAGAASAWILWRLVLSLFRKSPLDNVPGPASQSMWTGNLQALFDPKGWDFHQSIAQKYGGIVRIDGPMKSRMLYVFDTLALHHIIVKDQPLYSRNHTDLLISKLMFGEGLLSVGAGDKHRKQRKMLNPVFNNVHLRRLSPVFYGVAHRLRAGLTGKVTNGPVEVDILHWMNRCALELIGQGGLGYSFDNLADNPHEPTHPYSGAVSGIEPLIMNLSLAFRFIFPWASRIGTPRFQRAVVDWVPWKAVHDFRDILDIMDHTTRQIFIEKKRALESGGEEFQQDAGKDIMSILMKENARAEDEDRLPDAEVIGQMSTLIFAATETTSTSLARILYLMAQNSDVQDRLRAELTDAQQKYGTDIPYDQLMQLPFLDAVCRETLRLHPPSPFSLRTTAVDTVLPLAAPLLGRNGEEIHALHVPRGTDLMLSIQSANCDASVWGPDAEEWKPARWLVPLPETVTQGPATGVYQYLFTFGGGPRACIGFKFSQLELKIVLAVLLPAFRVSLSNKRIVWNLGFIVQPSVDGSNETQLPLVLTLL